MYRSRMGYFYPMEVKLPCRLLYIWKNTSIQRFCIWWYLHDYIGSICGGLGVDISWLFLSWSTDSLSLKCRWVWRSRWFWFCWWPFWVGENLTLSLGHFTRAVDLWWWVEDGIPFIRKKYYPNIHQKMMMQRCMTFFSAGDTVVHHPTQLQSKEECNPPSTCVAA